MSVCWNKKELVSISRAYIGDDTDTNYQKSDTNLIFKVINSFIYRCLNQYQAMIPITDTNRILNKCK